MDRNEEVGVGAIRNSGALGEADENVGRARELCADAAGFQSGFETRRDLQREVLLLRAGRRLRAGIVAAVTRIDHHEEVTWLMIVLVQGDGRRAIGCGASANRPRILRRFECDRTRDRWGRASRRIVVNDNRRRDIRIGASGRDSQHDFISVFAAARSRSRLFRSLRRRFASCHPTRSRGRWRSAQFPNRTAAAAVSRCACVRSSIQSSLPCVLRSSRGVGPLKPKWSSRVGPRCSIRAEVSTDAGTLARASATIAQIVVAATAIILRTTAACPLASRIAADCGDCDNPPSLRRERGKGTRAKTSGLKVLTSLA